MSWRQIFHPAFGLVSGDGANLTARKTREAHNSYSWDRNSHDVRSKTPLAAPTRPTEACTVTDSLESTESKSHRDTI